MKFIDDVSASPGRLWTSEKMNQRESMSRGTTAGPAAVLDRHSVSASSSTPARNITLFYGFFPDRDVIWIRASRLMSRSCLFLLSFTSTIKIDRSFLSRQSTMDVCCSVVCLFLFSTSFPAAEFFGSPGETFVSTFWPNRDDPRIPECSFDFLRSLGKPTVKVLLGMAVRFECTV